ncbi:helix-turn-helix domain-containing protein [Dysgonomonas gadei]|uniref:HTH araC/xylS-type domain-containing protein n=1 Tax=Dysgonomonas gadei ATCC BAA-286 TaxID=742766 RepID=F5ITU8_9BACT|nr:helix-turn-helix domain-containing protein [Dysgonomonas gadei]EGJ99191.1 hypothetical protein HMPREF9455_00515 [Dysgonomonas gadei ATCC BAA-286]
MENKGIRRIKTISEFHRLNNLPAPEHPLFSIVDYGMVIRPEDIAEMSFVFDFYQIAIKRGVNAKIKYGQQEYDFDEGIMSFISHNQILRIEPDSNPTDRQSGYLIQIHPCFLRNTSLGKNFKNYEFFQYSVNEALFLSEKEENIINNIIQNIQQEYHSNIDKFSQCIVISQLETLLNYADRFYQRQFITRKITNHQILDQLEKILSDYFKSNKPLENGLPTVQYVADTLHLSASYLSGLLKSLTGQSTQQHIQNKLIELAKEKLTTTDLSISEIAYELGFEYSQSFSKLFKSKTNKSPQEFRQSFN